MWDLITKPFALIDELYTEYQMAMAILLFGE